MSHSIIRKIIVWVDQLLLSLPPLLDIQRLGLVTRQNSICSILASSTESSSKRGFTGSIERFKFVLDGFGQTVLESLHFQLDLLKADVSLLVKRSDDGDKYEGQKFASKT